MTPKGQDGLECLGPGCSNTVEQKRGSGRRRRYCCDNCGARYRNSSRPASADSDAYAVQIAKDYAQLTQRLEQIVRDGRPDAALQLLTECGRDWLDLRAALVQQARQQKMKAADIAAALHISKDTLSRTITAEHIAGRRERRAPRLPDAAPAGRPLPHQRHP
ncbi:hypothetical protein, partial [Streptomyces sp. AK02-01A]|uniref:hypothetical protein n=1 Tax=Streptomyces sp. AK02-01A TaxID=3028648 RepID=UPI0029BCE556